MDLESAINVYTLYIGNASLMLLINYYYYYSYTVDIWLQLYNNILYTIIVL